MSLEKNIKIIHNGGIGVFPTDTLYGIVGSAFSKTAVERIYKVKGRHKQKPFIILISSINDIKKFGIVLNKTQKEFLWLANLLRWFFECCLVYCLFGETKGFPQENQCVHNCPCKSGCKYLYYQYHYTAIFHGRGEGCYPFPPEETWLTFNFRD